MTVRRPAYTQTIFVKLLNEGTGVWRPVSAVLIGDGTTFRIVGPMPEDEEWEFGPGSIVSTRLKTFSDGKTGFVAVTTNYPMNNKPM